MGDHRVSLTRRFGASRLRAAALGCSAVMGLSVGDAWAQSSYGEAPDLAERVAAGDLPPVADRLPAVPLVVEPVSEIGSYGGTWRSGLRGGGDEIWLVRINGYENLVAWDRDWQQVVPNVAESFEVSDDATQFTFRLRDGMKWSTGIPLTAEDIAFAANDILINSEIFGSAPTWLTGGGEPPVVEALDPLTVRFTFAEPYAVFLQQLATAPANPLTMYSKEYCDDFHPTYTPDANAVAQGAGYENWTDHLLAQCGVWNDPPRWQNPDRPSLDAWIIDAPYSATATEVTFARNPYYWKVDTAGNQLPYIDRLALRVSESVDDLVLRAMNGEIDFQDRHIATLANKPIFFDNQEAGDYRLTDTFPDAYNTMVIAFNLTHQDPALREVFNNRDFRVGLSHALDRQEIIDAVFIGQGQPFQIGARPESKHYHERLATQYTEYDVDLANQHLDQAGYADRDAAGYRIGPDGERIGFTIETIAAFRPEWIDMLELVRLYWQEVGVDVSVNTIDRTLYYDRREANLHDAQVWVGEAGFTPLLDPRFLIPFSYESIHARGWELWFTDPDGSGAVEPPQSVQEMYDLYQQAAASPDTDEQDRLIQELFEGAADAFHVMGISLPPDGYAITGNDLRNVPERMPAAWVYPSPGPVVPAQFFFAE